MYIRSDSTKSPEAVQIEFDPDEGTKARMTMH